MMTLPLVMRGDVRPFVIIGGGEVAARKVRTLVAAGASVRLLAENIHDDILALQSQLTIEYTRITQLPVLAAGTFLVLATDNAVLNAELAKQGREQDCLVCRTDDTKNNDFMFPAVIDRSPLLISISSSGASPALTRHVRQRLEAFFPQDYRQLAIFAESLRERVKRALSPALRAVFWRRWFGSMAPEFILGRQLAQAETVTERLLKQESLGSGEVWLVGAGPGDPDLLTFRALRLIQSADIVYYDRLVNPLIMALLAPDAERYYVGKERSNHSVPQDEINQLLVDAALAGKKVLRLKGGDPFIFGRGGEEIEQLAAAGVPFQVVPGITAASGCAAYAGIPLTHRDHAQSVRFVTGHLRNGSCDLPWHELIHPQQTLVIYMGLSGLPVICEKLLAAGMAPNTPIALVEKGTLPDQKVHVSTLQDMPSYIQGRDIQTPTLSIVGSVVSLHETLRWR